jgi:hypothetical protein
MPAMQRVFDPTAPSRNTPVAVRRRLDTLAGKVVGFIDNTKPNFNHLIDDLAELLVARHGVRAIVKRSKRVSSIPAPAELIAELAGECDVVITGSGD